MEHNAWVTAVLVGFAVCGCGIDADGDLFGPAAGSGGSAGTSGTAGNSGQGGASGTGGMKPAGSGGTGGMMTAGHSGSGGNTAGSGGTGGNMAGSGGMTAGSSGTGGSGNGGAGTGGMTAGTGGSGGMTAGSSGTGGAMSGSGGMTAGSSGTAGTGGGAGTGGQGGTGGGPVDNVTFDTLAMGCFKAVIIDDATNMVVSGSGDTDVCPTELASIYVPPGGYTLFVWVRDPTNNLLSFNSAEGFTVIKGRCSLYPTAPTWAQMSSDFATKSFANISNSAVPPSYLYLKSCPANGDAEYTIHK